MTKSKVSFLDVSRLKLLFLAFALAGIAHTQQSQPAQSTPQSSAPAGQQPKTTYESSTVLKVTSRLVVVYVVAVARKGPPAISLSVCELAALEEGLGQKVHVIFLQQPFAAAWSAITTP